MRDFSKIPPKAERVLTALLHHGVVRAAATDAGVSEATVFRYLQDAEFQRRYRAARADVVDAAVALMQCLSVNSVAVLASIMEDKEAPASSRIAAAKTILEQSIGSLELMDLRARVEQLEATLPQEVKGKGGQRWA